MPTTPDYICHHPPPPPPRLNHSNILPSLPSLSPSSYSVRQLHEVCGGDHICYLCQNDEEKWRVLSQFYKTGLERKEKMMFFQHQTPEEEVLSKLEEYGVVGIRDCIATGQFTVYYYKDIYMVNGIFEPADMILRVESETKKCLAEGYPGLRGSGDMSWVMREQGLMETLLRYESQLHIRWPENYAGLCMYDTRVFKPGDLMQVLVTHPQVVINEKLLQNFYFLPPDDYLGPNVNQAMLNRWMLNIEERKSIEEQLIAARMEAERAIHNKVNFLATMSHEIRNSTNGIIGSVDMLYQTKSSQEQIDLMNIIQASANHLEKVVNDVLDFSKIESGRLELYNAPLKVQELILDSIKMCQYSIQKNASVSLRSEVHHTCPERIIGDQARLRQILVNLIGNASKFTEKGEVVVSVKQIQKMDSKETNKPILQFEVTDSGIGIPQKDQYRVFQTFPQIGSTQKFAGTGLGLAICKQLVETMGGQIMINSVEGKGSTFYFQIPVDVPIPVDAQIPEPSDITRPIAVSPDNIVDDPVPLNFPLLPPVQHITLPEEQSPTLLSPPSSPLMSPVSSDPPPTLSFSPHTSDSHISPPTDFDFSNTSVLLVDDDITNQKVLTRMFAKMKCKITVASNGLEAIHAANANSYNLIVTDQSMPVCDGFTAVTQIRADYAKAQRPCPPIIACTGTNEARLVQVMDDIIIKPVRFQTILDLLTRFVANQLPII